MMIPTFMTLVLYIFWYISNNFLMRKHFLCRWRSFVGENQLAKYVQHLPCLGSVENLVLVFHQVKYSKWHQLKHLYQHQTVDIKSNIFLAVTWQLNRWPCHWLSDSLTDSVSHFWFEHYERLVTLETFNQSDEETILLTIFSCHLTAQ